MADFAQKIECTIDIDSGLVTAPQRGQLTRGDRNANKIVVTITEKGKPFDLSGVTVSGRFYRPPDAAEVTLEGSADGNVATVIFNDHCYTAEGYYEAEVVLTQGTVTRTIISISGHVHYGGSGRYIDIENVVPSLDEIIALYAEMKEATLNAQAAANRAPYVANGKWWVWNAATGQYTNTGINATGSGVGSVNGVLPDQGGNVSVNLGDARFLMGRNYMDNGHFAEGYVVNQRGQTSYSSSSAPCIDRWILRRTASVLSFVRKGIRIITTGTASSSDGIMQSYAEIKHLAGRTVTLAARVLQSDLGATYMSVSNASANNVWGTYIAQKRFEGTGIHVLTCTIPTEENLTESLINVFIGTPSGVTGNNASTVFEWAALLDGEYTADMLTGFAPERAVTELQECKRYYQRVGAESASVIGHALVTGNTETLQKIATITIPLPVDMRSDPTAVMEGNGIYVMRNVEGSAPISNQITAIRSATAIPGGVMLYVDLQNANAQGVFPVRANGGAYITLSAEI